MAVLPESVPSNKQPETNKRHDDIIKNLLLTLQNSNPKCFNDLKKHTQDKNHQLKNNSIATLKMYGLNPRDQTLLSLLSKNNVA